MSADLRTAEDVTGRPHVADRAQRRGAHPARPALRRRLPARLVTPALVFGLYLALRLLGVLVLWAMLAAHDGQQPPYGDPRILSALLSWDGGWYLGIAENGYPTAADIASGDDGLRVAFFPLFPLVTATVSTITFLPLDVAALVLNVVAGSGAAFVLFAIGRRLYSAGVGFVLVVLWAAHPTGLALSMAYAESLFCLLAFGGILLALREKWLAAGLLLFVASLTRGQGFPIAAGVVLAVVWLMWRERRPLGDAVRAVASVSIGVLGFPAWFAYIGVSTGNPTGWSEAYARGWGSRWDWFATTPEQFRAALSTNTAAFQTLVAVVLVAAIALFVMAAGARVDAFLFLPGALMLLQVMGSSMMFHTKPRLLLPVILLLVPMATAIARMPRTQAVVTIALYALFGSWFGAYAIVIYYLAI